MSVCGYVADGGLIMGHILDIKIAVTDPLQQNVDSSRLVFSFSSGLSSINFVMKFSSLIFKKVTLTWKRLHAILSKFHNAH